MSAPGGTLIRLEGIRHTYGTVVSLDGVDLALHGGEIHALVGEHGAGKSSLAMVVSGELMPRSGSVLVRGEPVLLHRSKAALRCGIKMVYEDILLNEHFSVAESLFYADHSVNRGLWISQRRMEDAATELFDKYRIRIDPSASVRSLSLSERTVVGIFSGLQTDTAYIIIDEGLDNLTAEYHRKISDMLREKVEAGIGVLLITHKIEDIYDVADRVSIMRNGRILATDEVRNIDKISLLRLTYTQMNRGSEEGEARDFHNLLKYNEAILQFLPINLVVADADNRIELVNDKCKQYFGLAERYFNTPLSTIFGPANIDVYEMLMEAFAACEERTFYRVTLVIDGGESITNIKTLPILDGESLIGNIIIIEDISEFEKLQDRLILSEKLASVGLLAAGVAHEINNPLEIIYNYLAYLRYNMSDQDLLKIIDTVQNEMVAISGIVSNLVSFSDKKGSEQEAVDIVGIVEEILHLLKFNAEYRKISFSLESGDDRDLVRLNRNEFKQVILNLIKNSFEAMPEGGEIRISASAANTAGGRKVIIVVQDTGAGIAEENIKNIFLPFYSTKKGQESNLGLGLSISYSIVQRCGGTISVTNNPERGCTFTIELPVAR
jgi:signal transduction histidine kinase/ABC-type multidrug transport system ATPase subunit